MSEGTAAPTFGTAPIRIGNCSGFYGDRLSAMREMLTGGELDVLTGDYLAELTMLILGKDELRDADAGYARTFLRQMEDCLGLALEQGVRIVSNGGGLNPSGLATKLGEVARDLGLAPRIAYVAGDDLRDRAEQLGFGDALTANAYLGGFGVARALGAGADIVVTGRVTDASVVLGPAVWHHGWRPEDHDALAGGVVAGHVIECGCQATGGNFSGFRTLHHTNEPLGFPIAEVAADGGSVITKHEGTGGAVTVDTVTAQLVYEIQSTRYFNPDVTTLLDSVRLTQQGDDRVQVSGVHGEAPPERLKVCVNALGGYRNSMEFVLTGLDVEAKGDWVRSQLEAGLAADRPAEVTWSRTSVPHPDADSEEAASCVLRCTVKDPDADRVGKNFTGTAVSLTLASYPGMSFTAPPGKPSPYGVYRPEYVPRSAVEHVVVLPDGTRETVPAPTAVQTVDGPDDSGQRPSPYPAPQDEITRRVPLGSFVHARSGDKGGDANVGLWVRRDDGVAQDVYDARVTWLTKLITPAKVRELVPEAADLDVDVFCLPNLGGVNVIIHGLLGEGVAASTRFDPQAKGLGEWIRSRMVPVEERLL